MRSVSTVILTLVVVAPVAAQERPRGELQVLRTPDWNEHQVDRAAATIDADFLLGHTRFLASDLLEGRGPGTRGEALAQEYIAAQWESFGLEPAGAEGWLQPFRLLSLTVTSAPALTVRGPAGEDLELAWREEWIGSSGRQETRSELDDVEVVFVGYGIVAPEVGWDDYEEVDVSGKVLLFLNNDPVSEDFAGETRLYYGRWSYKYEIAAEKGAAGALVIHTTPSAGYGWNVVQSSWSGAQFELPAGDMPGVEVEAWLTEDAARRLVALAGRDLDELVTAGQRDDFRAVPLGVTVSTAFENAIEETETANVIGRLPGSDPDRAAEHVLFTAHYDHLGVGEPVEGDSIHNGARDNALGTASIIALARAYAALPEPPRRSLLFAAVGAEEQGLLGSQWLAREPVVPNCDIVANINIDGGNIWGRTRDVRQVGRGKSDLDRLLDRFAAEQERTVLPEEFPDKGYYYRSDQFSFAKVGIPAIYLDEGVDFLGRPEGWGKERIDEWLERRYHQPSDEVTPEWDLTGAAEDGRLLFRVGHALAQSDDRPAWTPGDEFAAARAACP